MKAHREPAASLPLLEPLESRLLLATWAWDVQTVDASADVGRDASLAVSAAGNPAISYYDATSADLKFAAWNGAAWDVQTVDSAGDVGQFSSLALDATGAPRIAYYDTTHGDLKYAAWNGAAWDIRTVASTGNVGQYASLALDAATGDPRIAYYDATNACLMYTAWNGSAWGVTGASSSNSGLGPGITLGDKGKFGSLVLDSAGNPQVGFLSVKFTGLNTVVPCFHLAKWDSSLGFNGFVMQSNDAFPAPGGATSLLLDHSGNARVAYSSADNGDIIYAVYTGTAWNAQTVATGGIPGQEVSLALDASDNPHLSYFDAETGALTSASYEGAGWHFSNVGFGWGEGNDTVSTKVDASGRQLVAWYDSTTRSLKLAAESPVATGAGGEIRGTNWNDLDDDGLRDADELGLAGATMYLDLNGNGLLDGDEPATVSGDDGSYAFTGLAAGTYQVRRVTGNAWTQTLPFGACVAERSDITVGVTDEAGNLLYEIPLQPDPHWTMYQEWTLPDGSLHIGANIDNDHSTTGGHYHDEDFVFTLAFSDGHIQVTMGASDGNANQYWTDLRINHVPVWGGERFTFWFAQGHVGEVFDLSGAYIVTLAEGQALAGIDYGWDVGKPTANLTHPTDESWILQSVFNTGGRYIDVTFSDKAGDGGLDLATILDSAPEFTLSGPVAAGVTVNGAPTLVSGTTYRYSFTGNFGLGVVSVDFLAGAWADSAGHTNIARSQTFMVLSDATSVPPVLTPLVDQTLPHSEGKRTLTLPVTGPNGDLITYTAVAVRLPDAAYELKTRLGLVERVTTFDSATRKWFRDGGSNWYYIEADGKVYAYSTGQLQGQVDAACFVDPALLLNAQEPPALPDGMVTVDGHTLTIDPPVTLVGSFRVDVTATEAVNVAAGEAANVATGAFTVTVTNTAPVLDLLDQTVPQSLDKWTVVLPRTDADGDLLEYTASGRRLASEAYLLKCRLGLNQLVVAMDSMDRKWFKTWAGTLYYIEADGKVYGSGGQFQGQVDSYYFISPAALSQATYSSELDGEPVYGGHLGLPWSDPLAVHYRTLRVAGNILMIDPMQTVEGQFQVDVTATDGAASVTESFIVTLASGATPVLNLVDQTAPHNADTLQVVLPLTAPDGATVRYAAYVDTRHDAHDLRERVGLVKYVVANDSADRKWLQDGAGAWFYIVPDGRVYRSADGALLAQLDGAYFDDPQLLLNAQEPVDLPEGTVSVAGNVLTFDPPVGFGEQFQVDVSASNGPGAYTQGTFIVTIANTPPAFPEGEVTVAPGQDMTVTLPVTDADGDAITYTATINNDYDFHFHDDVPAYEVKQWLGLTEYVPSMDGGDKKWIKSDTEGFVFITPSGYLYSRDGRVVSILQPSYYANPQKLVDAQEPSYVPRNAASLVGNQLTFHPPAGFEGQFHVDLTASDGLITVQGEYFVTVANSAPTLNIPDQTQPHTLDSWDVTLPLTDVDGQTVTYTAEVRTADAAYDLKTRLGLVRHVAMYDSAARKWLQDGASNWFYIAPDGNVFRISGQLEGQVDGACFGDPQRLLGVQAPAAMPAGTVSVTGNILTIDPPAGFVGQFQVDVTASDGAATVSDSFSVTVVNTPPALQGGVVTIPHSQDQQIIALPATDADGDVITYTAETKAADPAYDLKTRLGLAQYVPQWDGGGRKWLQDNAGGWFYIVTDGGVYSWNRGLEGQLDASFYADPQKLIDARQPQAMPAGTVSVVGNQLTIDPPDGFLGQFQVEVTAGDGVTTVATTYAVEVVNQAPDLNIADQAISYTQDKSVLTLPATDADGDIITYTAATKNSDAAFDLKQRLNITRYVAQWDGGGKKWLQDNAGGWFYIVTDGGLFRWGGGLEGQLDASFYADPLKLINALQPPAMPAGTVSIVGNQLTIDPPAGFVGQFQVEVTASDGVQAVADTFVVSVANQPPVLNIADQTQPGTVDKWDLTLPLTDADGEAVQYTAVPQTSDPAYDLKQRLGLAQYVRIYDSAATKWLLGAGNTWYCLSPDGTVRRWFGGVEGQVDASYFANPQLLIDLQQPAALPAGTVTLAGNVLTIDPPDGFTGKFTVNVTASDGVNTVADDFLVQVV